LCFWIKEFIEIGNTVVILKDAKRANAGQDTFKHILCTVRCEDGDGTLEEREIQTLLKLDRNHPSFSEQERTDIHNEATYINANKEP
jgi:hypothetical protein